MKLLLAVPDWNPLGTTLLQSIQKETGDDGVRVDVHPDSHELNWAQVIDFSNYSTIWPLFLLAPGTMRRESGDAWTGQGLIAHTNDFCLKLKQYGFFDDELRPRCGIEIGNEPDLAADEWKDDPKNIGRTFAQCVRVVRRYSATTPVLSPSISNLNKRGFRYLEKMLPYLPADCSIAFHRYPAGREFSKPHDGSRSREVEIEQLRYLAGGRALWHTEGGWAEINRDYTLSELEVAERMADEVRFWRDQSVECVTLYQLNSGTWKAGDSDDHKRLSTYGARRVDGSWKPWAKAVKAARAWQP